VGIGMNIIFLDIDGVMNHRRHMIRSKLHKSFEFCPKSVEHVKQILEQTNSKIVLSSSWRIGETIETFKKNYLSHYRLQNYLVGMTPFSGNFNETRGLEIQQYINLVKNTYLNVDRFIIIDDDKDMSHLMSRLVHCTNLNGLDEIKRDEAIRLFSY
jgi:hypothetical protein